MYVICSSSIIATCKCLVRLKLSDYYVIYLQRMIGSHERLSLDHILSHLLP